MNYILSTVIVAVIAYLVGDVVGVIGLAGAIVAGALIAFIAKRNFVIANGDVLGMSSGFVLFMKWYDECKCFKIGP